MTRNRSASSRTSSVRSESELTTSYEVPQEHFIGGGGEVGGLQPPPHNKIITVNELDQMRMPNNVVNGTDAEVREAIGGEADNKHNAHHKKSTWQELEIQRRLEVDKLKERREHEHGSVGELHSK